MTGLVCWIGRRRFLRSDAARQAKVAEDHFNEALRDLQALDVHCLDPAKGMALIPFGQGDDLAWFLFDLFAPQGLVGWRFDADPPETRRLLPDKLDPGLVDRTSASRPRFWESRPTGRTTNRE